MILGRVAGNATSTVCHSALRGVRLLLCEVMDATGAGSGRFLLCGDWQGAGLGDLVLITSDGEAASRYTGDTTMPMRNVIVGLVDDAENKQSDSSSARKVVAAKR